MGIGYMAHQLYCDKKAQKTRDQFNCRKDKAAESADLIHRMIFCRKGAAALHPFLFLSTASSSSLILK